MFSAAIIVSLYTDDHFSAAHFSRYTADGSEDSGPCSVVTGYTGNYLKW